MVASIIIYKVVGIGAQGTVRNKKRFENTFLNLFASISLLYCGFGSDWISMGFRFLNLLTVHLVYLVFLWFLWYVQGFCFSYFSLRLVCG